MLYHTFHDNHKSITKHLFVDIQDTFTIEFWAKPVPEAKEERYAVIPVSGVHGEDGGPFLAGVGISLGVKGIKVYEHEAVLTETLAFTFPSPLYDWTHVALVYHDKIPSLYINGQFVKKGNVSSFKTVVPSGVFKGSGSRDFIGKLEEIRIWSKAKTQSEILEHMNRKPAENESGLFGCWKLSEAGETTIHDADGTIEEPALKILFTFFVPSGGVETLNRQRFYALKQYGVNCDFLYLQEGTGLQNTVNTSIFITNYVDEIQELISKGNYDAIVVGSDLLLLKTIREFGYQGLLIYEVQGLGNSKEYVDEFLEIHAYSIVNECSDAILYPQTPHLQQAFEKYFPDKVKFCFNNCFNTNEFHYQALPKKNGPIIGWVGRLEENKNWKDFLSIGAKLVQENPSIQLWMFEDSTLAEEEERSAFEERINELNLKEHLTVYANQPHQKMAEYFSIIGDSGGFLCSTSKVEGFGYAVLEAMVCRCPVLTTDSDGVRSFITHNVTGKFFELGDINQAVQEGKELISIAALREEIRQNALKHIEDHFAPEKYAEHFLNMIHQLKHD
ncbi:glycosyltransferase [Bacillus swezeyi]|uniref:glycosyltransferase n=1 Tax=Bacillus swezeyi TaxID=1925020 RepID=UPI0009F8299D|nr:glycosyltransferase [Bacillus swezeyi]MEC1262776.1 glycosyltransferase [Bacillus swezeyi]MED2928619.1 glycosyltransferase [Bacillus swezeyi]MED2962948.1 glycosyltransferase [Bacillus swezeyi]MED2975840.1 glycosyltransferase [Bacillus swezeyi]MED3074562.1 glycosyltransferase [Bacillus swezeyi]